MLYRMQDFNLLSTFFILTTMTTKNFLKKIKHNKFIFHALNYLAYLLIRLLFSTYRLRISHDNSLANPINKTQGVFCAWHQHIIASTIFFKKNNFSFHCIVSPSRDGKFAGALAEKFGSKVLYGSAHKQPIALVRNALRVLREDKQLFLIGDGSRGPAKRLQPGVRYLAQKADLPILFIDCNVQWKITLHKSWDKFQIPLPFSKIFVRIKQV